MHVNTSCFRRSPVCCLENVGECLQKTLSLKKFDFSDFLLTFCWLLKFYWFFWIEHWLFIDFWCMYTLWIYVFLYFSGTIWWTRSEQKVNEKWTKSQPKANFLWTKVTEKVNLDKNDFSPFLHLKSIEIDFSG